MSKLDIYCFTHVPINSLENLGYKLAGVSKNILSKSYIRCDTGDNIINKEKYYSEYVFHYWFWKNKLKNYDEDTWIGFCQKRRFWLQNKVKLKPSTFEELNNVILKDVPKEWSGYDSLIQPPLNLKANKIKMIKRGYKSLIKDPSIFFNEKKQTIKLHFDMHHGYGNLDKAIDVMNIKDREEFRNYVNVNTSFSPNNMFISKKKIIERWFNDIFIWLFECEKIFGFNQLKGYDTTRIYAYLAERYLSFWFKKYSRSLEWPWVFVDLK